MKRSRWISEWETSSTTRIENTDRRHRPGKRGVRCMRSMGRQMDRDLSQHDILGFPFFLPRSVSWLAFRTSCRHWTACIETYCSPNISSTLQDSAAESNQAATGLDCHRSFPRRPVATGSWYEPRRSCSTSESGSDFNSVLLIHFHLLGVHSCTRNRIDPIVRGRQLDNLSTHSLLGRLGLRRRERATLVATGRESAVFLWSAYERETDLQRTCFKFRVVP